MVHLQAKSAAMKEVVEARRALKQEEIVAGGALAEAGADGLHVVTAKVTRDPVVSRPSDSEFDVGVLGGREN
jgi:hypothetical protein